MTDPAGKVVDNSIITAEARVALERLRELAAELVAIVNDPDADDATAAGAGRLLVEIGPAAVEPLVQYVCDDPKRGREAAAAILCEIGEPAVEPLLACFEHADPDVRATVAFLFTALRDSGPPSSRSSACSTTPTNWCASRPPTRSAPTTPGARCPSSSPWRRAPCRCRHERRTRRRGRRPTPTTPAPPSTRSASSATRAPCSRSSS